MVKLATPTMEQADLVHLVVTALRRAEYHLLGKLDINVEPKYNQEEIIRQTKF